MSSPLQEKLRRTLLFVTFVTFAINLMIPVGYMPAAIGSGSPVMLCHSVLPAGVLHDHHGHESSEDDAGLADADDAGVVFCPLGTLAGTLVLPGIAVFDSPSAVTADLLVPEIAIAIQSADVLFHARAPPLNSV